MEEDELGAVVPVELLELDDSWVSVAGAVVLEVVVEVVELSGLAVLELVAPVSAFPGPVVLVSAVVLVPVLLPLQASTVVMPTAITAAHAPTPIPIPHMRDQHASGGPLASRSVCASRQREGAHRGASVADSARSRSASWPGISAARQRPHGSRDGLACENALLRAMVRAP